VSDTAPAPVDFSAAAVAAAVVGMQSARIERMSSCYARRGSWICCDQCY